MDEFYLACNDKCFKCIFLNPQNQYLLGLLIERVTEYKYRNMNYSNVEKKYLFANGQEDAQFVGKTL